MSIHAAISRRTRCDHDRPAPRPTIRAQPPLVFDVSDARSGRSFGGATHHVGHPGGRDRQALPADAKDAGARRRARFFPLGHTPRATPAPRAAPSRGHPRTLDLRRLA